MANSKKATPIVQADTTVGPVGEEGKETLNEVGDLINNSQPNNEENTLITPIVQADTTVGPVGEVNVGVASTTIISSSATNEDVNKGLTKVKIGYPENYSGKKFFVDGDVKYVSAEVAENYITKGIAQVIE